MKKMRKGFTLIELLIVVAIMAALSAMMAASSADSIDSAQASAILNNLQSMKTAAYEMYMNEPAVASEASITNSTKITITPAVGTAGQSGYKAAVTKTVSKILGEYLGRVDISEHYGIYGDASHWYVYYEIQTTDSTKVKTILADKANKAGILCGEKANDDFYGNEYYLDDYINDPSVTHIALMVR